MCAGRIATVLLAWGLMLAPALSFATVGELGPEGAKQLDDIKTRMAPEPYKPSNAPGCQRWKGKGLYSRDVGLDTYCLRGCELGLVDADGSRAQWEFTGQRCRARPPRGGHQGRADDAVSPVAAPAPAAESVSDHPVVRYVPAPARKGQAKNYHETPREAPPPGHRAVSK